MNYHIKNSNNNRSKLVNRSKNESGCGLMSSLSPRKSLDTLNLCFWRSHNRLHSENKLISLRQLKQTKTHTHITHTTKQNKSLEARVRIIIWCQYDLLSKMTTFPPRKNYGSYKEIGKCDPYTKKFKTL